MSVKTNLPLRSAIFACLYSTFSLNASQTLAQENQSLVPIRPMTQTSQQNFECDADEELCEAIREHCDNDFFCELLIAICEEDPEACRELVGGGDECDEEDDECEAPPEECTDEEEECEEPPEECNEEEECEEPPEECDEEEECEETPEECDEEDNCEEPPEECNEEEECEEPPEDCDDEDQECDGNGGGGNPPPTDPGNGGGHHNHCMMIPEFADLSLVTHAAAASGRWSDTATWGGELPGNGAVVQIPQGVEVTIASQLTSRLETVRIDGLLKFATDSNTELQVDNLVSSCDGHLQVGTASSPIQADVSAKVVFIDDGAVSDSKLIGRGAILMGRTEIQGAAKTHKAIITPQAKQGDSVLTLNTAPSGWNINDQLVITGTVINDPTSDEIRTISQVNGNRVILDKPLSLDHTAPKADLNVYVANTSRNVEFISENTAIEHRGHMMFMSHDVSIRNARFTELGRTDKTRPLDDFEFQFTDDSAGDDAPAIANVVPLGGKNVRGRYAIHFHQVSTDPASTPAVVKGSVVFNGPGWGFVNHSSHVNFIDNVSYGLQGAGFYTEAGDEIGSMQGNIAIRSVNSSFELDHLGVIDPDLGAERMDYGNDGDGFWLTGNQVSMINNVAAGASAHGIIYWTDGIMEITSPGQATRVTVPVNRLTNGELISNRTSVPVWWAPLAESRGNESYGATVGFRIRYIHAKNYLGREEESEFHRSPSQAYIDTLSPTIDNLTVWGSRDGVLLNYNERVSLNGARIIGFGKDVSQFSFNEGTAKSGIGLDIGNDSTHGPAQYSNIYLEGFAMGLATPVNGVWEINDMVMTQNGTDILVQPAETTPTEVNLRNVQYSTFQVVDEPDATELPPHISLGN